MGNQRNISGAHGQRRAVLDGRPVAVCFARHDFIVVRPRRVNRRRPDPSGRADGFCCATSLSQKLNN